MSKSWLIRFSFLALLALSAALTLPRPAATQTRAARWYKGNLHTHTLYDCSIRKKKGKVLPTTESKS